MQYLGLIIICLGFCQACFEEADFSRLEPIAGLMLSETRDMNLVTEAGIAMVNGGEMLSAGTDIFAGTEIIAGTELGAGMSAGEELEAGEQNSELILVGEWVSEGADVAPLLREAPLSLSRLQANFKSDQSFLVTITNQQGESFNLSGQYSVILNQTITGPHEIELRQAQPEASFSQGIWTVENDILTYEVVQVEPPLPGNNTPPNAMSGFGSSNQGELGSDNVQVYRRRP